MVSRAHGARRRRITLLTCLISIAVIGLLMAVTRSWGKDEWLFALLAFTLTAVYLALDYSDQIIK